MLTRAISAFVIVPGTVAYAIPIWIGHGAPLQVRVLLFEEPWAARTFGEQWQAYRARVRRWIV